MAMGSTTGKKAEAITPHATNQLTGGTCDAIQVGDAGTVVCRHPGNGTDTTWKVPAGGYILCRTTHVRATSSPGTNLIAIYY